MSLVSLFLETVIYKILYQSERFCYNFAFERKTICTQFKKKRNLIKLWNRLEIGKADSDRIYSVLILKSTSWNSESKKKNLQSKTEKRSI